jgi:addiction module HigA family antidote
LSGKGAELEGGELIFKHSRLPFGRGHTPLNGNISKNLGPRKTSVLSSNGLKPIGLTQGVLADAMGVQRKHVNELCNDRRNVTAATALILARCSAIARISGSMCSGEATCGKRCIPRVNVNGSNARGR